MSSTTDPLAACRSGECDHFHPTRNIEDPERCAERRVRDAMRALEEAIRCLPAGSHVRRQFEAGGYASWRTRAHALLFEVERERREYQAIMVALAWAAS